MHSDAQANIDVVKSSGGFLFSAPAHSWSDGSRGRSAWVCPAIGKRNLRTPVFVFFGQPSVRNVTPSCCERRGHASLGRDTARARAAGSGSHARCHCNRPVVMGARDHALVRVRGDSGALPDVVSITAGSAWYTGGANAILELPSVIAPEETIVLINAQHPDADRVTNTACFPGAASIPSVMLQRGLPQSARRWTGGNQADVTTSALFWLFFAGAFFPILDKLPRRIRAFWGKGKMTIRSIRLPLAAAVLVCAYGAAHAAKDGPGGHDPSQDELLSGMAVHAVAAHDRLKSQITYGYINVGTTAGNAANSLYMNTPGLSYGSAAAAGLAGGLIASALINAEAKAAARNVVRDANTEFERAQCKLSNTDALMGAIERSVGATPWGAGRSVQQHVLPPDRSVDDLVPQDEPRYELVATYSMTPDYSALVTSVALAAYSAQLPGAPTRWQKKPALSNDIVVVSDVVQLADKTPADVEAAISRETARYADSGVYKLIQAANAGDRTARRTASTLLRTHKSRMREAKGLEWTPREAAAARARAWAADDCGLVRSALAQGATDVETLLSRLFAGSLPARAETGETVVPLGDDTDRVVQVGLNGQYVARAVDAHAPLGWRYSWYPEDETPDEVSEE